MKTCWEIAFDLSFLWLNFFSLLETKMILKNAKENLYKNYPIFIINEAYWLNHFLSQSSSQASDTCRHQKYNMHRVALTLLFVATLALCQGKYLDFQAQCYSCYTYIAYILWTIQTSLSFPFSSYVIPSFNRKITLPCVKTQIVCEIGRICDLWICDL